MTRRKWGRAWVNPAAAKGQEGRTLTELAAGQPMALIDALATARWMTARLPVVITTLGEAVT
jgi:hypothetical protein